jgi:hypothetical protein
MVRLQSEIPAQTVNLTLRNPSELRCEIFMRACVHSVACCVVVNKVVVLFRLSKKGRGFLLKFSLSVHFQSLKV